MLAGRRIHRDYIESDTALDDGEAIDEAGFGPEEFADLGAT